MTDENWLDRREFGKLAAGGLALGATDLASAGAFTALRDRKVTIGILVFPNMDQMDFTGPFEVLARLPNARVVVIGSEPGPFKDMVGLTIMPDRDVASAPELDLLQVTGGPGQIALMDREPVLALIRNHVAAGKPLFSVCTGALTCGAAGVLQGRRATTHWASYHFLPYFGAIPVRQRVVVDGALASTAGVSAGIDGALTVAALLRGEAAAERIQLDIQYAPEPPFHAGSPDIAPSAVVEAVTEQYRPVTERRLPIAKAVAARLGVTHS